ncbi:MAG: cytochrome c3 family protein [Gammaproteobacteria bacterium]|nr:cytochrome c3 family protein [Gammaproteobacteria bacterium]
MSVDKILTRSVISILYLMLAIVVGISTANATDTTTEAADETTTETTAETTDKEAADTSAENSSPAPANSKPDNSICLGCHGFQGFAVPGADGAMRDLHVDKDRFLKSVHAKRGCVECHKDIIQIPHRKNIDRKVGCVQCHRELWDKAQREGKTEEFARLAVVVKQIDSYMNSVHARPNIEDQSRTNATCYNCHNAHYIFPEESMERVERRLEIPNVCGKCHQAEKEQYLTSVHGNEVTKNGNINAAICSDCHTTHNIESPELDAIRLQITQQCGTCHRENLKTYMGTYHGQVNRLGYAHTAKCFDCHGSHGIKRVDNPESSVHINNRLETCSKCHKGASKGFVSFHPHGNTHDYEKYPYMWIASKFMIGLLAGVFTFFWGHALLWFYREYKERQQRNGKLRIKTDQLHGDPEEIFKDKPEYKGKHFERFTKPWRILHLALVLGVMLLVLTGMTVLYADSFWAPTVMKMIGGPEVAGVLHRIGALTFISVFVIHLLMIVWCIIRNCKTWTWFGSRSLMPNWQDFKDAAAMFRWFFGKGPRPVFDKWAYWEKFDYWAPFWGLTIVGVSGIMMWFPEATASLLPGWVFNVATIIHGEEAFLAAVFLFTVHFFNSHFRPDKFPQDIAMFTGTVPLEEYKHEHTLEYQRLVESGELEKHLVEAPSQTMTTGSKILGATLLITGLGLLALVLLGFWENVLFG